MFTSFIGRRDLLTDVRERLGRSRVVTLLGPGGVGKTRVALRVVDLVRQARRYPDGTWVATLDDVATAELLASTVGDAIGLQIRDMPLAVEALTDYVADREALLVLDNCEHLYREVGMLVDRLRTDCPHLAVLLTSRRPLVISGEDVVTVQALSAPEDELSAEPDPQALEHYESVQLFVERATAALSGFELSSTNAGAVARLCAELAGNPLAIELAASRIRVFTPQEIVERLADRFELLNVGYQDAPDRHRSLLACVEWSHSLCSAAEQRLWDQAWVFSGGFTLDDAEVVCRPDDDTPTDTPTDTPGDTPTEMPTGAPTLADLVGSLVDQSVLVAEAGPTGGTRYAMLADIREYGRASARAAGLEAELHERHVRWVADLAARFAQAWVGPDQAPWLARVEVERANVRAALQHGSTTPELTEIALEIAVDLDMFWSSSGRLGEAQTWCDRLVSTGLGAPATRARASVAAARYAVLQGDGAAARVHLGRVADLAVEAPAIQGLGLIPAAVLALWEDDGGTALEHADRAVDLLTASSATVAGEEISGMLLAHLMAGVVRYAAGDLGGAAASFGACVAEADVRGEQYLRSYALNGLGDLAVADGALDRAADLYREGLRLQDRLGDRLGRAVSLDSLGRLAVEEGRGQRAALLLGAAAAVWDSVGMTETGNLLTHTRARAPGIESAKRLLGTRAFRDQYRRGSQLVADRAVAFALDPDLDDVSPAPAEEPESHPLTKRELEVAGLVAEGLSNPQIADRLVISVRTAQGHVENILRKLGFSSRSLIAAWVAERRLSDETPGVSPR